MKRILPEEVVAAYRATGLRPVNDGTSYSPKTNCGCGLAALYVAAGAPTIGGRAAMQVWACREYDSDYLDGFTGGFDDVIASAREWHDPEAFVDGAAAWQAVVAAGLVGGE